MIASGREVLRTTSPVAQKTKKAKYGAMMSSGVLSLRIQCRLSGRWRSDEARAVLHTCSRHSAGQIS